MSISVRKKELIVVHNSEKTEYTPNKVSILRYLAEKYPIGFSLFVIESTWIDSDTIGSLGLEAEPKD